MNVRPSITILGVPFDNVTTAEALERIEQMVLSGEPHYIATANVDFLVQAREDVELRRILFDAHMVLCDGTPLIWVSRLLGNPLPERVAGADVVPRLIQLAAEKEYRLFFLGATPDSVSRAVANLLDAHPNLRITGYYSPPFNKLIEMDHDEIKSRILAAKPDLLLVSFGCPKQEKWIAMHYRSLGVPVAAGVGATIDFLAGKVSRAPLWMQRNGLEWVYRLLQEPRRLFRRYIKDLWIFSWAILAQWWALPFQTNPVRATANTSTFRTRSSRRRKEAERSGFRPNPPPYVGCYKLSEFDRCYEVSGLSYRLVICPSALDAFAAQADRLNSAEVVPDGRHCFLQMAGVTCIDSTGVGHLISFKKKLRTAGRELVLIAPSETVRRALDLMRISEFFDSAPDVPSAQYLLKLRARERSAAVTLRTAAAVSPLLWHGEITASNVERVWQETRAYLESAPPERDFALDLSDVRFVDSSGLALMIRAKKLARQNGITLIFKSMQPAVRNVVQMARLEDFFENEKSLGSTQLPKPSPTWDVAPLQPVTNAAFAASHE